MVFGFTPVTGVVTALADDAVVVEEGNSTPDVTDGEVVTQEVVAQSTSEDVESVVTQDDQDQVMYEAEPYSKIYDGKPFAPTVVASTGHPDEKTGEWVEKSRKTLTLGTDYDIYKASYTKGNNEDLLDSLTKVESAVDPGDYYLGNNKLKVVKGDGYSYPTGDGDMCVSISIKAVSLSAENIDTTVTYDGTAKSVQVKANGVEVQEGKDYTVTYTDANGKEVKSPTEVGTYVATVTSTTKYDKYREWDKTAYQSKVSGSATGTLTILPATLPASAVSYTAHVQGRGWAMAWSTDGQTAGTVGKSKRLEALAIKVNQGSVTYRAHVQGKGWQNWVTDGAVAGTTGKSKRVEAVEIKLDDETAKTSSVWYRVHSQKYGWLGWAQDGQTAGTTGKSKRAEAIEVQILPKGTTPEGYDASKAAAVTK